MTLRLRSVVVGESGSAWERAGFTVVDDVVHIGDVSVICTGDGDTSSRWILDGAGDLATVDGIAVSSPHDVHEVPDTGGHGHRNRVVGLDHVVVRSPDVERTTSMLENQGIECRRVRDVPMASTPIQQRFFRIPTGPDGSDSSTIIELVGPPTPTEGGPAWIWGLACTVDDIDAAVAALGDVCSDARDAVQPGRRIATVRTRDLGIRLTLAVMSV